MDAAESEMEEADAELNGRPGDDTKVAHFCVIGPGGAVLLHSHAAHDFCFTVMPRMISASQSCRT